MPRAASDERLTLTSIRARYNNPTAFGPLDVWHQYTATEISRIIEEQWKVLQIRGTVLNAGSGGNCLGIESDRIINLDLAEWRLAHQRHAVVANVEALPLADATMSAVVCVGSVINYCDAAAAVAEFGRVIEDGGYLIIEFESSRSGEYVTTPEFGQAVAVCETFYCGRKELVWGYRIEYLRNLLESARLKPLEVFPIHVLSPWVLFSTSNLRLAAHAAKADSAARKMRILDRWASNFLIICRKHKQVMAS